MSDRSALVVSRLLCQSILYRNVLALDTVGRNAIEILQANSKQTPRKLEDILFLAEGTKRCSASGSIRTKEPKERNSGDWTYRLHYLPLCPRNTPNPAGPRDLPLSCKEAPPTAVSRVFARTPVLST
jgi:hypothetical protein